MTFDECFALLLGHEGEYSDDVSDPGNWTGGKVGLGTMKGTKWGISAKSYPHLDIKNLTKADAKKIYRDDFWNPIKGDELPPALRFHVFDAAVNSGPDWARIWLQRAVGAAVDGKIGPATLAAAHRSDQVKAAVEINTERLLFMTNALIWQSQSKGWARRIAKNLKLAVKK